MNLNLSMSSRKSRLQLATGHRKLFATHTPADPIGLAPLAAPDDSRDLMNYLRNYVRVTSHLHIADGLK